MDLFPSLGLMDFFFFPWDLVFPSGEWDLGWGGNILKKSWNVSKKPWNISIKPWNNFMKPWNIVTESGNISISSENLGILSCHEFMEYHQKTLESCQKTLEYCHEFKEYQHKTLEYSHNTPEYCHEFMEYQHKPLEYFHKPLEFPAWEGPGRLQVQIPREKKQPWEEFPAQFQGNRKKTKSSINKPLTPINLNPKKTPGNTQNSRGILAEFQDFQWNAATVQGVSGEGFPRGKFPREWGRDLGKDSQRE